jgi:hypothetical protein
VAVAAVETALTVVQVVQAAAVLEEILDLQEQVVLQILAVAVAVEM